MKYIISIIIGVILTWLFIVYVGVSSVKNTLNYQKLFVEKQNSLIIGTSRAAKLNADLISKELGAGVIPSRIFNFAFNLRMSPYGSSYNQSIIRHTNFESNEKGVFIICVDPWALSERRDALNVESNYSEHSGPINFDNNQKFASILYFFQTYSKPYINLFIPEGNSNLMENESKPDESFIRNHLEAKIESYKREHFYKEEISKRRFSYLENLIDTLKTKGEIYLVKLPVSKEMIKLEDEYSSDFDKKINLISGKYGTEFIDFYKYTDSFLCPDGNHLWSKDADKVSLIIGDIIRLKEKGLLLSDEINLLEGYLLNEKSKYRNFLINAF